MQPQRLSSERRGDGAFDDSMTEWMLAKASSDSAACIRGEMPTNTNVAVGTWIAEKICQ